MSLFLIWHMALSSLFGLIFAAVLGSLGATSSALALLLAAVASYFVSRADSVSKSLFITPSDRSIETLWLERIISLVIMYVSYRHFLYLFYVAGTDFRTLNPNNFGDLPLHINYIRTIANGSSFPWVNPSFSSDYLRYPLGIDLYNALWEAVGVRLQAHLLLVGLVGCALIVRFTRILSSWWGLVGIFFSGGFAGWLSSRMSPTELQSVLAWKNIFLAVIVTQRGFLFALPAGIYLILRARRSEKLSWNFGLLWGLLAFFHLHSFVIVSLVIGGESLIRKDVKKFYKSLLIAVPLGSLFVLYSSHGLRNSSFLRWQWGWTNTNEKILNYLSFNFGPYLFIAIFVFAFLAFMNLKGKKKLEAKNLLRFYSLYLFLFFIFFNLIVAPWDWDNIKVLIWPYLLLIGVWSTFNSTLRRQGLQSLLAVVLSYSGWLAIQPSLLSTQGSLAIYNLGEIAKAQSALAKVPADSVFLAATTHNHPLTYFGKIRAVGYEGHLWSHGIDAKEQVEKLKRIFSDDPSWRDLAHDLHVTHIYWGKDERAQFGNEPKSWQKAENNISTVEDIAVYEIK